MSSSEYHEAVASPRKRGGATRSEAESHPGHRYKTFRKVGSETINEPSI